MTKQTDSQIDQSTDQQDALAAITTNRQSLLANVVAGAIRVEAPENGPNAARIANIGNENYATRNAPRSDA